MIAESMTGSRIRERRVMQGLKQADLARDIGISASYLNLIEHNRRRIGGKLLLDIAARLEVEPQALTEGAEAALLGVLGEAALAANLSVADTGRAEAFASRFPGWAEALAASQRRIATLERTVEALSDRMAHDPHLADSMHELLTTAAAVRSTAEILASDEALEREWQDRFHANLDADSDRLARSAQALVGYLEQKKGPAAAHSPHEEVETYLEARDFIFPLLEEMQTSTAVSELLAQTDAALSDAARFILRGILEQIADDARAVPLASLQPLVEEGPIDPVALASNFGVSVAVILRRLAAVPDLKAGLVVCDRSGTVIFRKSVDGFSVPRFDHCCPLWPLFAAFGAPQMVLHERLGQLGRAQAQFDAYATTETLRAQGYNRPSASRAIMLLVPTLAGDSAHALRAVGATCRICPHDSCAARREPSIMTAPVS
ncbi:XRE family transcriptional regulator [uncultured Sulfitobacter sp.]|uniref:XRE family transcriptional regulator n=1 Tax=uncultured Sulfitobacter sp. TaxID=191468 RepID=UPI00263359E0|nr:XRE family transcriptional regulator [uncultured Sulfitobacter sp.]